MSTPQGQVREPAVAGSFYPADAHALRAEVDSLLHGARAHRAPGRVCGLLAPHAGFAYSGSVAASAFRCLAGLDIDTVVLIGPSHVEAFDFSSVFSGTHYRTPLGDVAVDVETARALAGISDTVRFSHCGHVRPRTARGEHALEVELPFLQVLLPDARILPVVMGTQRPEACRELGGALARALDAARTVIVASSDLSHFHDYARAQTLDATFCAALARLDGEELERALAGGRTEACGAGAVLAMLHAVGGLPGLACDVLAAHNSGDVTGDRSSVVGYASAVITTHASGVAA